MPPDTGSAVHGEQQALSRRASSESAHNSVREELALVLRSKLSPIPAHHLPRIHLEHILNRSPIAVSLANIPPDLQLPFYLRHYAQFQRAGFLPLKSDAQQPLYLTRAIFFYRLSPSHQFQRYHDASRWNIAIFLALLTLHHEAKERREQEQRSPSPYLNNSRHYRPDMRRPAFDRDVKLLPTAVTFMIAYLTAVLEHHRTPGTFKRREDFVRKWKDGGWDVFERKDCALGSSLRKRLRQRMKHLGVEWECLLDAEQERLGGKYATRVGRFVGSIVQGRKDQAVPNALLWDDKKGGDEKIKSQDISEHMAEDIEMYDDASNDLLDALKTPLMESGTKVLEDERPSRTVVSARYAVAAVENCEIKDMLATLMRLFPVDGANGKHGSTN